MRNLAVWVVVALMLFTLFNIFQGPRSNAASNEINFSQFTAQVDAGNIADVTIALDSNAYTGTIPSQLGYMVDVTNMNLNVNEFTGAVPTELGGKVLSTCTCIASYLRLPALTISVCTTTNTSIQASRK